MPRFRSQFFLNTASARDNRQAADSVNLNRQIDALMRNLRGTIVDYSEKDRRRITRKAAQKIATAARSNPGFSDSKRPHSRKSGGRKTTYNPGNLRRSLKVLSLRRTSDAYVGPQFAKTRSEEYGGPGQPVDGYYAAMLYGSSRAFVRRVLTPALQRGSSAALRILNRESEKAILTRAVRRGLNVR